MICGTGCDIVEVDRFKKLCSDNGFIERYFNEEELDFLDESVELGTDEGKLQSAAEHLAARFAVKEAFGKAAGTGIRNMRLKEIFTVKNKEGRPEVKLCGNAERIYEERFGKNCKIHVSISHEKKNALAFLIIEKE